MPIRLPDGTRARFCQVQMKIENYVTWSYSIIHPLRGLTQLFLCVFGVPDSRIQVLVAKDLGQPDKIAWIVFQVFVRHGVAQ